jgi:hypothetical protein
MRHKKLLLIIFGLLFSGLACTTQEPILVYVTPTPDTFGAIVIDSPIPTVDVSEIEPTVIVQIPTIDITQVSTLQPVSVSTLVTATNLPTITATPSKEVPVDDLPSPSGLIESP